VLFFRELQRRLAASGSKVTAYGAHPGYSDTELQGKVGGTTGALMNYIANTASGPAPPKFPSPPCVVLWARNSDGLWRSCLPRARPRAPSRRFTQPLPRKLSPANTTGRGLGSSGTRSALGAGSSDRPQSRG
jgi:hypothetical protein